MSYGFKMHYCNNILLLPLLPLLLLLLLPVVAIVIDGNDFKDRIEEMAENSLGVQEIQKYLDSDAVKYKPAVETNGEDILNKITEKMSNKFVLMNQAVEQIRNKVQKALNEGRTFTRVDPDADQYTPCCKMEGIKEDPRFPNLTVNTRQMCVVGPTSGLEYQDTEYPEKQEILETMQNNLDRIPGLKWQYIALEQNYVINYPAADICWPNYAPRRRPWYKETASVVEKDVVIVFDVSRSMQSLLRQAKGAVKAVLNTLGPNDRIGIVAFDSEPKTPVSEETDCYRTQLARTISENIPAMEQFVDNIWTTEGASVYSKAFHKAFQYFINSPSTNGYRDKVILFLSDGKPTDSTNSTQAEAEILGVIREQNAKLENEVIIQTFGIDISDTDVGPKQLMERIAHQTRADTNAGEVAKGEYRRVENVEQLREMMATFYSRPVFNTNKAEQTVYTVPYHDGFGFGIVLTACLPIHRGGDTFEGVACVDMLMRDLISDLTAFQNLDIAYTFMLDGAGRYVYHPLLPLSTDKDDPAVYADFTVLERSPSAMTVRHEMLSQGDQGSANVTTDYVIPRGTTQRAGVVHKRMDLRYFWGSIPDTGFSVCVVLDETELYTEFDTPVRFPPRVLYHRTDLTQDPPPKCNHFNRMVFKDNATVILPEKTFREPESYYNLENIDAKGVKDIERYLEGISRVPPTAWKIEEEARNTVAVLYDRLQAIWRERQGSSEYTMQRYLGTRDGVFINTPGDRNPHYYDHRVRSWYLKAKHSEGRYVLVGPYKDASSGQMIVTLGKTVTVSRDQILGVAAMDFSLIHLFYHLTETFEECNSEEYVCIIMDDNGMIILHKDFIEKPPDNQAKLANQHLAIKEPDVARELFKQEVITRNECFNSKTIKYQQFTKVEIPDHLNRGLKVEGNFFAMHKIPSTNFFLIVKQSRHTGGAQCFCGVDEDESGTPKCKIPPSLEDCECPCNAIAQYDYCENQLPDNSTVPLPCFPDAPSYTFENLVEIEKVWVSGLQPCYRHDCPAKDSQLSCRSVFSCSWCEDTCRTDEQCQQVTASGTETSIGVEDSNNGDDGGSGGAPIGAIIGGVIAGVMVIVIVVLLAVLMYRRRRALGSQHSNASWTNYFTGSSDGGYSSSQTSGAFTMEPEYETMPDITQKAATFDPKMLAASGPPGSPPTWGGVLPPTGGPLTLPRMTDGGFLNPVGPDPYSRRPLPIAPPPAGPSSTPPPGLPLPRVPDIYNNPRDLGESPPSERAPEPPSSQQIIEEIKKQEESRTSLYPDTDDETCHSIADSQGEDSPYKNTSFPEDPALEEAAEPPYTNTGASRSFTSESCYQRPAEVQELLVPPRVNIARLSAEQHPRPPPVPPHNDGALASDSDDHPSVNTDDADGDLSAVVAEPGFEPPYTNTPDPYRRIPRPPSLALSENIEADDNNNDNIFENPELLEDFVREDGDEDGEEEG